MSILEKKEKNLNELLDKLNILTSTYSHSTYKSEKIETEKNELIRKKSEIVPTPSEHDPKKSETNSRYLLISCK